MLSITPLSNITVNPNAFVDIERRQSAQSNDLLTWFNDTSFQGNLIDPFIIKSGELSKGFAPFTKTNFVVDGLNQEYCVEIFDPFVDERQVICVNPSGIMNVTEDLSGQKTINLYQIEEGEGQSYNIQVYRNNDSEYWVVDVIRLNNNVVWKKKKISAGAIINLPMGLSLSGNQLILGLDFSSNISGTKWEIKANAISNSFSRLPNNVQTLVREIDSTPIGITTFDISVDIGSYLFFTYVNGSNAYLYKIGLVMDDLGNFTTAKDVLSTIGSPPAPDLSISVGINNVLNISLVGVMTGSVKGFAIIPTRDSFELTDKIKFAATKVTASRPLSVTTNAHQKNTRDFTRWIVFAKADNNVNINDIIVGSSPGSLAISENIVNGGLGVDGGIEIIQNDGLFLNITNTTAVWDLYGYNFNFGANSPGDNIVYRNYGEQIITTEIPFNFTSNGAAEFVFTINTPSDGNILFCKAYILNRNSNIQFSGVNILNSIDRIQYPIEASVVGSAIEIRNNVTSVFNGYIFNSTNDISNEISFTGPSQIISAISNQVHQWKIYGESNDGSFYADVSVVNNSLQYVVHCQEGSINLTNQLFELSGTDLVLNFNGSLTLSVTQLPIEQPTNLVTSNITTNMFSKPKDPEIKFDEWILISNATTQDISISRNATFAFNDSTNLGIVYESNIAISNNASSPFNQYRYSSTTTFGTAFDLNDRVYRVLMAQTQPSLSWNISGVNYTDVILPISTKFNVAAINEDETIEYIFSHPYSYSIGVSAGNNPLEIIEDVFTIEDIPPKVVLGVTENPPWTLPASSYTPLPNSSFIAYFDTTVPSITSTENNYIFLNLFSSRPGAFPIGKIDIDFGDNTGITRMMRGIEDDIISDNTEVFNNSGLFLPIPNDLRRFAFLHKYPLSRDTYTISVTAYNIDTWNYAVGQHQIFIDKRVALFNRLIKNDHLTNGGSFLTYESNYLDPGLEIEEEEDAATLNP